MQHIAPLGQQSSNYKLFPKFKKVLPYKQTHTINPSFLKESVPLALYPKESSLFIDEYARAKSCISRIPDPLWKDICADLLTTMGPASVLKIWESKLGEFSSQNKVFHLTCETEKSAAFAQQYDFVILGSLQRYFPALKELKIEVEQHSIR